MRWMGIMKSAWSIPSGLWVAERMSARRKAAPRGQVHSDHQRIEERTLAFSAQFILKNC